MNDVLSATWLRMCFNHPDYQPQSYIEHDKVGCEKQHLDAFRGDHNLNFNMYPQVTGGLRVAGVLVPVIMREAGLTVLFTRRTDHLNHHPGQISFPGGRAEPEDQSVADTALREAYEEVGLERERVEIIGHLDDYLTRSGFVVTPVVGLIEPPLALQLCENEVAEAFEVPLAHLLDDANYKTSSHEFEGYQRHFYSVSFDDYYIWGATAGMLVNLHEMLGIR